MTPPIDLGKYANETYAREGEDILLKHFFPLQEQGFYVDVGAFHPVLISSTYIFYKHGWRGINIDAMPGGMAEFERLRPNDINLEAAIARDRGTFTYYMYPGQELNTLSHRWVEQRSEDNPGFRVVKVTEVQTYPLCKILDEYLPSGQNISFMDVDVEGMDLDVLQSNDWERYRPRIVLAERLKLDSLDALQNDPLTIYMASVNYSVVAKTYSTVFFMAREQPFDWFR